MKKIISFALTLTLCLSIGAISALAAYSAPSNSETCKIKSNQAYKYSKAVIGTYKLFGAENKSSSKHKLRVYAQYFDAGSNKYLNDKSRVIEIGEYVMDVKTDKFAGETSWRVYLTPYSIFNNDGCNGSGYIWHR